MLRKALIAICFALCAAPGLAQSGSLADIRTELAALAAELQVLRGELVASGAAGIEAAGGASVLDRMTAIEATIVTLTARTESLQNRIDRVVADGTNRIGDLEFRLCELEEGCDVSALPITTSLGGGAALSPSDTAAGGSGPPELAVAEQVDFDRAKASLEAGDFRAAADRFTAFAGAYTGGPLTGEAHFLRGEALSGLGETANAARAYLEAFSGQPDGPRAADSLLRLGQALGQLDQAQEACVTLFEVGLRFPQSPAATEAAATLANLDCP